MDLIKLLEEAEKTLYFVSCSMPLAYTADYEEHCLEISNLLETVEETAEATREKITTALVLIHSAADKIKKQNCTVNA